jgi:transcriptional regulator with XRE-family HTH domain
MSKRNPFESERIIFKTLIKNIRLSKKITQTELVNNLDKSQSFISKYEKGDRTLDFVEVYQILNAMNVPMVGFVKEFERLLKIDRF